MKNDDRDCGTRGRLLAITASIPLDAPVTIATFPVNLLIAIFLNA
jgi:hypothetical protein